MIKYQSNPWEGSFENLTQQLPGKPVGKAVTETVGITAEDISKQLFGEKPLGEMSDRERVRGEEREKKRLAEVKRRMAEMEAAIKGAREKRIKKEQESLRVERQEKQVKKEEKKKRDIPIWQKAMKMRSQAERRVNAGG